MKKKTTVKEKVEPKKTGMSMKEYARLRNVSYELIRRYCKQGRITRIAGKIDPAVADKELEKNVAINGNAKLAKKDKDTVEGNPTVDYNKAKARREKAKANLAELEYNKKAGKVHCNETCAKEAEDLYRTYRDQMLNVVIRASKKLLGETNEFKFRKVLKVEIENAIKRVE